MTSNMNERSTERQNSRVVRLLAMMEKLVQ